MKPKDEKHNAEREIDKEDADGVDDVLEQGGAGVLAVGEHPRGSVDPAGEGGEAAAEGGGEGSVQRREAGVVEGGLPAVDEDAQQPAAHGVAQQRREGAAVVPAGQAQRLRELVQADPRADPEDREEEKDLILNDFTFGNHFFFF